MMCITKVVKEFKEALFEGFKDGKYQVPEELQWKPDMGWDKKLQRETHIAFKKIKKNKK